MSEPHSGNGISSARSPLPSSLSSSATSTPGYIKQTLIAAIAICVVGYLAIVYFEVRAPPAGISSLVADSSLTSSARSLFGLGSSSCHHAYYLTGLDQELSADERIDHLLYRTLKLAINAGDELQAAAIAKQLAHSYKRANTDSSSSNTEESKTTSASKPSSAKNDAVQPPIVPPSPVHPSKLKPIMEFVADIVSNRSLAEWDEFYAAEERLNHSTDGYTFIVRDSYHLSGNHKLQWNGCKDIDGEQCSADSIDEAEQLCTVIPACLGFVCNKGRHDCQLRVAPLLHNPQGGFRSYYKNSVALAAADTFARERSAREIALMQPGVMADDRFDFDGVCGEDGYKCVIAYGLYGSSPKYVEGAMENIKLQPQIFPGWVVRIYHDSTVPHAQLTRLAKAGAELVNVESLNIKGDIAGMFWRFLVADDLTVDRYIIRDTDSRLNEREAAAVGEWMRSGYSVHSIRDHPNHDRPLNGGLWGGVKGAIKNMQALIVSANKNGYGADLSFLCDKVWPIIKYDQIAHDSYSCHKYVNSVPFPTKRPDDFQHVGQVFENNEPREGDISCCLRNNPAPKMCRKDPSWTYG